MLLDIDGAGRSRSLPAFPQPGECSTHERPGTWRRPVLLPEKVITLNPSVQALQAAGWFFSGLLQANFRSRRAFKTLKASRGLQRPQAPPGSSRGLSPLQRASRRLQRLQASPGVSKEFSGGFENFLKRMFVGFGAFIRAFRGFASRAPFSLSEPSAYTNEKVLLLTKMDLTEFRS